MKKRDSAYKHGITEEEIDHAVRNPFRIVEQEYDGEIRQLIIGADASARLLEIVVTHDEKEGPRVIHADVLRPKFYEYLR